MGMLWFARARRVSRVAMVAAAATARTNGRQNGVVRKRRRGVNAAAEGEGLYNLIVLCLLPPEGKTEGEETRQ